MSYKYHETYNFDHINQPIRNVFASPSGEQNTYSSLISFLGPELNEKIYEYNPYRM